MIDDLVLRTVTQGSKVQYLLELLAASPVESFLYSDAGPPADAPRCVDPTGGIEALDGWVEIGPGNEDRLRQVSWCKSGNPIRRVVTIEQNSFDRIMVAELPPEYLHGDDPEAMRLADAHAMLTADTIQADLFVTDRVMPFALGRDEWTPVTLMRPEDALPIVGLYLRRQRRFVLARSPALGQQRSHPDEVFCQEHYFYWETAETLLRDSWRWRGACDIHARSTGNQALSLLSTAVAHRLSQVLRARDSLLATAAVTQDMDTAYDLLDDLDAILIYLMASFDSLALICHFLLRLNGSERSAGWQRDDWTEQVTAVIRDLAPLFEEDGSGTALMTLLSRLRNIIHGQALSATGLVPVIGEHALESFMALPHADRDDILESIDRLGGHEAWGILTPLTVFDLHIHPGTFAERLIAQSVRLMNQIMIFVPIEHLDGIDHPENFTSEPTFPRNPRPVWQLGLSPPIAP